MFSSVKCRGLGTRQKKFPLLTIQRSFRTEPADGEEGSDCFWKIQKLIHLAKLHHLKPNNIGKFVAESQSVKL